MDNYRLYIDESGHHRYQLAGTIPERYLCLCGVIISQDVYIDEVIPRIEGLRSLFYTDPDLKPPLHLEDILKKRNDFAKLRQKEIEEKFNRILLDLYANVDYKIISIVIDKTRHYNQYVTPEHPYHYCLSCLLERYIKFLRSVDSRGDRYPLK